MSYLQPCKLKKKKLRFFSPHPIPLKNRFFKVILDGEREKEQKQKLKQNALFIFIDNFLFL